MALTYQQLLTAVPLVLRAGNVPNIVGEAGIGKSALVQEIAKKEGAKLFTTVVSLSEKGDLAIPVPPLTSDSFVETKNYGRLANVQFGYSQTLVDIIKTAEENPDQSIIWFLDEFNRGTQAVQSELMNLVLQRQINSIQLPDTVKIIIAENPDSSMTGFEDTDYDVTAGDDAIRDRTVRMVMETSAAEWLEWAKNRQPQINPLVIDYLTKHPECLSMKSQGADDLHPTPRAWERVATNFDQLEGVPKTLRRELVAELACGDLGMEVGTSFAEFFNTSGSESDIEAILSSDDPIATFQEFDEASKVIALQDWLKNDHELLDDAKNAKLFHDLLKEVQPDGQMAVAITISGLPALERMYNNDAEEVVALYNYLAVIATRGDQK
ncbi:MAG: ATP-binding protein [Limosilactobacillus sp.]|uniref:ATP-binding protein n=1 Tax=Limosilactobacillus sp. TaxID=2773925 RepID=UPI002700435F|nr:ATP-binding protein [Limosilactobacillus sp.]